MPAVAEVVVQECSLLDVGQPGQGLEAGVGQVRLERRRLSDERGQCFQFGHAGVGDLGVLQDQLAKLQASHWSSVSLLTSAPSVPGVPAWAAS